MMDMKPEQILKLLIVFHAKQEQYAELVSKQLIPKKEELYNYWTKITQKEKWSKTITNYLLLFFL